MKLNNKSLEVILVYLVLCSAALQLFIVVVAQQDGAVSEEETGLHSHSFRDLMHLIVDPIRATLSRARHLLSGQLSSLNDGADALRMKTFRMFMRLYNKTYSPDELPRRMALFFRRRSQVASSTKSFREGKSSFEMRLNRYADWDDSELKQLTGVSLPSELLADDDDDNDFEVSAGQNESDERVVRQQAEETVIPASKDWRTSGCISTPIDQKGCGACYAIATIAAVESMRCLNHVASPVLSPQQVVDCSTKKTGYDNHGCNGGWPTQVLRYLQDVQVAARETCYPFKRRRSTCRLEEIKETSGCTVRASVTDQEKLRYKVLRSEEDMLYHVAKSGPVVAVMSAPDSFFYYSDGIFDDPTCTKKRNDVDHAILIVGFGSKDGQDYWLLKNSWGTTEWGQSGFGLYKRGTRACSIGHWAWAIIE